MPNILLLLLHVSKRIFVAACFLLLGMPYAFIGVWRAADYQQWLLQQLLEYYN